MHFSHYIKGSPLLLAFLSENVFLDFITEELGQHVASDLAFASKNLKLTRQKLISDDRC